MPVASTSIPLATEDPPRPRTARNIPVTITVAPAAIRAPTSRASSPTITTPSLKTSRPSPQFTSTLRKGVPAGVVRTSGGAITTPISSIRFRLTRGIRLGLRVIGYGLGLLRDSPLRYLGLARSLFGREIGAKGGRMRFARGMLGGGSGSRHAGLDRGLGFSRAMQPGF